MTAIVLGLHTKDIQEKKKTNKKKETNKKKIMINKKTRNHGRLTYDGQEKINQRTMRNVVVEKNTCW